MNNVLLMVMWQSFRYADTEDYINYISKQLEILNAVFFNVA